MSTTSPASTLAAPRPDVYRPRFPVRIVTAASLFDGHDAAINVMRRILQASGAEVIHLGHNRSVRSIVDAAVQEDAQGIAISSYQGGHVEFFRYLRDMLVERGASHVKIFGGGGGTIVPEEKQELEEYGISRIYHPEDGRRMGLQGMINDILEQCDRSPLEAGGEQGSLDDLAPGGGPESWGLLARAITLLEALEGAGVEDASAERAGEEEEALRDRILILARMRDSEHDAPVIGMTGTGGAGKSSLTDEIVRRFVEDFPDSTVAVLSVDPTKKRTGGALLGDRIRMNSVETGRVFMRSLATRGSGREVSEALEDAIRLCRGYGFDLVIAETSGIGQADSSVVDLADLSVYVMTPEFGAQTQLEKIEMIDVADLVVVNKFDKPGAEDALRDVRKAYQRGHQRFSDPVESMPVYASMASQFNDCGCNRVFAELLRLIGERTGRELEGRFTSSRPAGDPDKKTIIPPSRVRYLAEIAEGVRGYRKWSEEQAELAAELWAIRKAVAHFTGWPGTEAEALLPFRPEQVSDAPDHLEPLMEAFNEGHRRLDPRALELLEEWPDVKKSLRSDENHYEVRGRTITVQNFTTSLSRQKIPKVALPRFSNWGEILRFRLLENVPGEYPYTAGVYPYKRRGEDPTRMFAGEGGPWRTNKRFHYLSRDLDAKRLSTAFDSVTLYGEDPDRRPDIWGKVGNSGVSIAHVEDMEALYAGFDLCDPRTSVSMTINGPAPTILAFFFNAAVRQQLRRFLRGEGRITIEDEECLQPDGGGYTFEDLREKVSDEEYASIVVRTVSRVRGTVQADILKEDQAQNTCIFSTEFALKMMGDVQQWFTENDVRNFYSVSISGYHIAEAGANPITQLALTLANGFTYVEYYLARGMKIDGFGPNLSFFFSNGMDPEYAVIGRVARRIWATAMREIYGGNPRTQKLKYHIQTSGRSLHAQEIAFNDIRTTLQALLAVYDNCNSLHTNAYDEAITTPTEESVRRAVAIQLILNQEFGIAKNENPNQGAYLIEELTDLVEEAVLQEFERIAERGGVLGAMERMYQRSKIQEESLHYESLKHTGELPIVGVNTFVGPDSGEATHLELIRASEKEKEEQLRRLEGFHERHRDRADDAVARLKQAVIRGDNVFGELMRAVEILSLGQITHALYEVGGQYRRSM